MNLSTEALTALRDHWAVGAAGSKALEHADRLVHERLATRAVGEQIDFSFEVDKGDDSFLERIALAYEMAAIEGLDELSRPSGGNPALRDQAVSASYKAFDIRRLMSVPVETDERLFFVLQISALAYCGDRWSDLRRWYRENESVLSALSLDDVPWDRRLLYRLFDCWVRLFRKNGWEDLDGVREIIAGLRDDQERFEGARLNNASKTVDRAIALRLVALYHWAKATEILALYMLQGELLSPFTELDKHFDAALKAAIASGDAQHEVILHWLHATARIMVTNSLWWATRTVNSQTSDFIRSLTHRQHQAMFELLPPQRIALLEKGLLDQAKTAIVIDMPTSGGKTLLAQFRMLQALNQFSEENGWIAYVTPTRALSSQITRRLRKDFEPIGLRIEQLTAAVEVDAFEEELLTNDQQPFHILVATPEKLSLVIRNKKVTRPLALVVMDEAHNIESRGRGLRIELLLATAKGDCPRASFLLLMPFVESAEAIARWLAQDVNAGQAISLGTTPWKPNERIIGLYRAIEDNSKRGSWRLEFETLTTTPRALPLHGNHRVGDVRPLNIPKSKVLHKGIQQKGFGLQTAAISAVMSVRGTSVAVANKISDVWTMAKEAAKSLPEYETVPDEIRLVQDFLRSEISSDFLLVALLERGVGVHHAGLSDDIRALVEWIAEQGSLRLLCATSTISQGINFPVSSVFLASRFVYDGGQSVEMAPREFWNLAGRAGRIGHDSVGVVGLAEGADREALIAFVSRSTGVLISRLVALIDELAARGALNQLSDVIKQDQWEDFRCYVAHLWAEKKNLDAVLADTEQLLRQTYGYTTLRNDPAQREKAEALLEATKTYARKLADNPGHAELADSTGFSPEGIAHALAGMRGLEDHLTPSDWAPDSLFGDGGKMADLFGVMLRIPQLKQQLDEVGGEGFGQARLSDITRDWVNGKGIDAIAKEYFSRDRDDENATAAITDACRAIYRTIVNNGTWGVSALSRVSGMNFDSLSDAEQRRINTLPAMIYHGVRTEDAVLMRMNAAPRSAAEALGDLYREVTSDDISRFSVGKARNFLKSLGDQDWDRVCPKQAALSGDGYKRVWQILSGEANL
jgi:superfamily II DNA/RNA helicase